MSIGKGSPSNMRSQTARLQSPWLCHRSSRVYGQTSPNPRIAALQVPRDAVVARVLSEFRAGERVPAAESYGSVRASAPFINRRFHLRNAVKSPEIRALRDVRCAVSVPLA